MMPPTPDSVWLSWTHLVWFPVWMALGTCLASLLRRSLAARQGQPLLPQLAPVAPGRADPASLVFGALFAAFALWFGSGDHPPLFYYARALLAEPGMGLVAFSLFCLARRGFGIEAVVPATRLLLAGAAVLGLFLYPLALGIGWFDPYALGYDPRFAAAALILATPMWWHAPLRPLALWLTLALLAWGYGVPESDNLWDQLLDPALFLIALGAMARRLITARRTGPDADADATTPERGVA